MSVSRLGALAALLGGVVWVVAAVLGWGEEVNAAMYVAGLVLLVLAFAALGYALVATAPVWLRAVVTLATPVLGAMVWLILRDAIGEEHLAVVIGGVLLLVGGGIGLTRAGTSSPPPEKPPARGRRAAR